MVVKDFDLNVARGRVRLASSATRAAASRPCCRWLAGLHDADVRRRSSSADKEIAGPGPDRGVVFQAPCLLPWMTALENVMLGVEQVHPSTSRARAAREIAEHYLALVGLGDAMRQEAARSCRRACGSASASRARSRCRRKMLLLDEPFGMLDSLTRLELQEVLLELWRAGPQDRADGHARRRRGAVPVRPRGDDDAAARQPRVGDMLHVPFARPRDRHAVLDDPDYYELRERLIGFLEHNAPHLSEPSLAHGSKQPWRRALGGESSGMEALA